MDRSGCQLLSELDGLWVADHKHQHVASMPALLLPCLVSWSQIVICMARDRLCIYGLTPTCCLQLNLPAGALQIASTALVLVSPFSKFALTLEPVAHGVDHYLGIGDKGVAAAVEKRAVRTGLSVLALVLAAEVPFFGVFMSLLGSFLTISVSIIFPCLAHLKLEWEELTDGQKALDFAIVALGCYATVIGTLTAFQTLPGLSNVMDIDAFTASHAASGDVYKTLACHSLCFAS
jgi:vesicular inhibitory amino acid transporter